MRNGYALPTREQLAHATAAIAAAGPEERHELAGRLRIGLQADTELTRGGSGQLVSQAYCSAVPIVYSDHPAEAWEPLARLVLDAAYEATLTAAPLTAASSAGP